MAQRFVASGRVRVLAPPTRPLLASRRVTPRRIAVALLCAVALAGSSGTASADPGSDARNRLAALARRVQDAEAREGLLADRVAKLDRSIARAERELAEVRTRFAVRARAMYESGLGADTIVVMMSTDDPGSVVARLELFNAATRSDDALMRHGAVLARTLRDQKREADAARRDAAATTAALHKDGAALRALLARAEAARARTARTAPRASRAARLNGRYACMVGPTHAYRDTWGAPRSGGRTHKGTDVFAPYGSPSYAVTDGVVRRESYSDNGGLQVYLRGNDGNEYFYAHMSAYVARPGERVTAGQEIAKVGDSGNARGGPPHVHFEVHPGGGAPVNPYPYVRRFCG
jgi:murein DD-endopeptidase MepM/ murein hydrolase activator NlpD